MNMLQGNIDSTIDIWILINKQTGGATHIFTYLFGNLRVDPSHNKRELYKNGYTSITKQK
jgi:hypothetical protein